MGTAHALFVATAATFTTALRSGLSNMASPTGRNTSAAASATGLTTSPTTSATGRMTSPTVSNTSSIAFTTTQPP